ncbi:MAG: hypothetical protein ACRBDI_05875 [Alphaproteobacteria bacterium]
MTEYIMHGSSISPKNEFKRTAKTIAAKARDGDTVYLKYASDNDHAVLANELINAGKIVKIDTDNTHQIPTADVT